MESSAVSFNPNIAQKEAILHKPSPLMILAGAGTGKTTTLLNRIFYLVQKEDVPRQFLFASGGIGPAGNFIVDSSRNDDITDCIRFHGVVLCASMHCNKVKPY